MAPQGIGCGITNDAGRQANALHRVIADVCNDVCRQGIVTTGNEAFTEYLEAEIRCAAAAVQVQGWRTDVGDAGIADRTIGLRGLQVSPDCLPQGAGLEG